MGYEKKLILIFRLINIMTSERNEFFHPSIKAKFTSGHSQWPVDGVSGPPVDAASGPVDGLDINCL